MRIVKRIVIVILVLALLAGLGVAGWHFFGRDGSTFLTLARRLEADGRYDWAVRCYQWAWDREPDNAALPLELAQCYADSGNYTKCEATLWAAIEQLPQEPSLYIYLSQVYVAQDKLLDAAGLAQQIDHPEARAAFLAAQPAAPTLQPAGGTFDEDCTVSLSYQDGTAYWLITPQGEGTCPSLRTDAYTAPMRLVGQEVTVTALVVGDNGLVSPIVTADYAVGFVDELVTITDPALDALLRQTMGWVDTVQLTTGLLATVESLTLPAEVQQLSQLSLLVNLTYLDATALARRDDWTCLAGLDSLQTLLLPAATLDSASLNTIGTLTELRTLSLDGCGLTTLAPLAGLTHLESLSLRGCSIGDLSPLSNMTWLTALDLTGNAVTDLAPLAGLSNLQELSLAENPVGSLDALQELRRLRVLNVASTSIDRLDALVYMTALEELDASGNAISTITVLSRLTALTTLNLAHNAITVADPLAELTNLTHLTLSYNQLTTLPDFADECLLTVLDAAHNQLEDISGLANLPRLNYVYLDYNQITDLSPLTTCLVLVQVDAFENPTRVAQGLIDIGVIVHYTPVFDEETGEETSIDAESGESGESDADAASDVSAESDTDSGDGE